MNRLPLRALCGALLVAACSAPRAQPAGTLAPVVVTGNPLASTELVTPADSLSGTPLLLRSQGSLGETLNGLPGVSSTYFGPAASRPVLRGLDGDRVRVLNNSSALSDVSSLSYDHAVAADPITVERIEVLRGPAALLYGGNAIGGVVNLIDNRIPRDPLSRASGRADLGFATGSSERSAAALIEGGNERAAFHADVFGRGSAEVRVPIDLPCTSGSSAWTRRRICNSAAEASGGAAGGTLFFADGYLGASASSFASRYGAVAEDEVGIDMRSRRVALEGELRKLPGWFEQASLKASRGAYRHVESEAGVPGTRFEQAANDLRLEARHRKLGATSGVWGLQVDGSRFSATGEEAFAPHSRTRQWALFAYEQVEADWGRVDFGLRSERVRVESLGNPDVARFATAAREFSPRSASIGALWKLAPAWELTANLSHSERAPKDYELFADGPHVATGAYEVGDAGLGKERSLNLDFGLRWKHGHDHVRVSLFRSRFRDYILLARTGAVTGDDLLPEFRYQATGAAFMGAEAAGNVRLLDRADLLDLEWRADVVRAENEATGEPLPRIAPARVGATLKWSRGAWGARVGADYHAGQRRVPAGEGATPGYALVNAALTYRAGAGDTSLLWYLRVDNALDRLAYSATSILTQSLPGRVPLPGRSWKAGLQASF